MTRPIVACGLTYDNTQSDLQKLNSAKLPLPPLLIFTLNCKTDHVQYCETQIIQNIGYRMMMVDT